MSNTTPSFFMPASEWRAPKLNLGDKAVVLYALGGFDEHSFLTDLECGDTTVVSVHANGSVTLANGFRYHANGRGYAKNNATVISTHHVLRRNNRGELPVGLSGITIVEPAVQAGHYSTFEA